MPRSHCEKQNVHFVQELAEVDGPFESPININFRDLTKLDLPPLMWNRNDIIPKKMKITNTGHTVIISGKWKCERPYLSGGPLLGRYVFSQIHFHWGKDDSRGSEHQVNGEEFPLEMHVAHFKTEYITQECALRERDGMVVVVYLFKLQEEPNASLKKILTNLPCVKKASTSHAIDPRPILSLCTPFSEDYFMYWGSVVTSTCAHILLWIVCREPFGISREQVKEFRTILDPSQQPICRNNRQPQPLHRRNVFHVNASKNLVDPLLTVKKLKGCTCRRSETNICLPSQASPDCKCRTNKRNQEDIEGNIENKTQPQSELCEDMQAIDWRETLARDFYVRQSMFVHRTMVQSVPLLPKEFGGENFRKQCGREERMKSRGDSEDNLMSRSCCFFPVKEASRFKRRSDKRKARERKKPHNAINPLTQIMESLDALKNHTFKKLREIDLINQEIIGLKFASHGTEEKKWFRKVEKIMSRQKRLTVRSSQGYFSELKKLARECTIDRFSDKNSPVGDNNEKVAWLTETTPQVLSCSSVSTKDLKSTEKAKPFTLDQAIKFTARAKNLIQSFFEDIKESEDLQQSVRKDLELKKKKICSKQAGDSTSVSSINKNYITQKMFTLGNLGDRFFTEVTPEDVEMEEKGWGDKGRTKEVVYAVEDYQKKEPIDIYDSDRAMFINSLATKKTKELTTPSSRTQETIPLHRANVAIKFSSEKRTKRMEELNKVKSPMHSAKERKVSRLNIATDTISTSDSEKMSSTKFEIKGSSKWPQGSFLVKKTNKATPKKLPKNFRRERMLDYVQYSSSNLSTDSVETQRLIIAKLKKKHSKRVILKKRSSLAMLPSKGFQDKALQKKENWKNINFEGYFIKGKSLKSKKKKTRKGEKIKKGTSSFDVMALTGKAKAVASKYKRKKFRKTKFKLEIEKAGDSTSDSAVEFFHVSPQRKKLRLESKKIKVRISKRKKILEENEVIDEASSARALNWPSQRLHQHTSTTHQETIAVQTTEENIKADESEGVASKHAITESVENMMRKKLNGIPWNNLDEFQAPGKELRMSSVDSKISFEEKEEIDKTESQTLATHTPKMEPLTPAKVEPVKRELPKFVQNCATKIKSLTNLTTGTRYLSPTNTHRGFIENLEHRRKSDREPNEQKWQLSEENPRIITFKYETRGILNKTQKKSDTEVNESYETQKQKEKEYSVGYLTASNVQSPRIISDVEEFITKVQVQEVKPKESILKFSDLEKHFTLDKELQEVKPAPKEPSEKLPEILNKADSNKSLANEGPNMKGDADLLTGGDNKELQTASFPPIKKNTQSRPHSAETLGSLTKAFRRKTKKRPHCCKRSSRHHIRKYPSVLKKLNKVQSRPVQFQDLSEEQQLKIISVNVARYLKEKLAQHKTPLEKSERTDSNSKERVKNKNVSEERIGKSASKETASMKETEINPEESTSKAVEKEKEEKTYQTEPSKKETTTTQEQSKEGGPPENKKPPFSPRPVHNFIKRNKIMAGKYKRQSSPNEREYENFQNKNDEPKTKLIRKKKEKLPLPRRGEQLKGQQASSSLPSIPKPSQKVNERQTPTDARARSSSIPKKPESGTKKMDKPKQDTKNEGSPPSLTLQRIPQPEKRLTPSYVFTSYLPTPVEIVQNQRRKINRSLVVNKTHVGAYLPEILYESKPRTRKKNEGKNDSLFMKDLEYLIKLQMCLNNEISANIENSMNYVKTMLSQDYGGATLVEKPPANDSWDLYDHSKKVVLIEMNNSFDCSSSSSEFAEEPERCYLPRNVSDSMSQPTLRTKEIPKTAKDFGNYGLMNPALVGEFDAQEGYSSDSSYNCEISITLNAGTVEKESDVKVFDTGSLKEIYNYTYDLGGKSSADLTSSQAEGNSSSQSIIVKPLRKKRKENEISVEMKKKLLEILENEIKREMAVSYGIPPDTLSEGFTVTWEDPDGMNRSHSTESCCENVEMFAQISETMRQYLTDFREKRFAERVHKPVDGESKEDAP